MGVFLGAFGKCRNKKTIIHKGLVALCDADNRHHFQSQSLPKRSGFFLLCVDFIGEIFILRLLMSSEV